MVDNARKPSLRRDLVLVLVTGVITGVIAPLIEAHFQTSALQRQKEQNAALARKTSVIQAQEKMLDLLSEQLLEYEFLAFKVSYYKAQHNENEFEVAAKQYDTVLEIVPPENSVQPTAESYRWSASNRRPS